MKAIFQTISCNNTIVIYLVPTVAPDLAELLAKLNEYGILQSVNAAEAKKKEEVQKKEEVYKPVTLTQDSLRM